MTSAEYASGRSTGIVRTALVSGTSRFADGFEPLPRVQDELRMMRAVLAEAGYAIHRLSRTDPTCDDLADSFEQALDGDGTPPDVLLFYYSGHGYAFGDGDILLAAGNSEKAKRSTMLGVDRLMSLIVPDGKPRPREVVVLIDACQSGLAIAQMERAAKEHWDRGTDMPVLTLISSTDRIGDAQQMHFADSFAAALRNTRAGTDVVHLEAQGLFSELKVRMKKGSQNPRDPQLPSWVPPREQFRAFPNPRYLQPKLRRPAEAQPHSGWAFHGRAEAARDVVAHLVGTPDTDEPGTPLLVTGGPGSGKSLLLDWIHACSEGQPLPTGAGAPPVPAPARCVDLLLDIRNWNLDTVVRRLAERYETGEPDCAALVEALGGRGLRLVFDSLDASAEPELIYRMLLVPLATQPRTRVVMAGSQVPEGFEGRLVDLDADAYFRAADLAGLVEHVLRNRKGTTWSVTDSRSVQNIAQATAAAAGKSWLRAYLFAVDMSNEDPATARVRAERSNADLFLDELVRISGALDDEDPQWARDMLLPLALAQGDGLPADGRLWAAVVRAAGRPGVSAVDLSTVQSEAGDYLDVPEDGMNSHGWRLKHPATAEYLADSADARDYHSLFVAAMTEQLPVLPSGRRDWSSADRYTRDHLPHHARLAGVLEEFLDDPEFLLAMNGEKLYRVLGLLQETPDDRAANVRALCWELMRSLWRLPDGHTLARLALHAQVRGLHELSRRAREYAVGWQAEAVDCRPPSLRKIIEDRGIKAVHCLPDGGELALSGSWVLYRPGGADDTSWTSFTPSNVPSREVPSRVTASSVIDHGGEAALFAGEITGEAWVALLSGPGQQIEPLHLTCPLIACLKVGEDLLIAGSDGWQWRSKGETGRLVASPSLRLGGVTAAETPHGIRVAGRTRSDVVVWQRDGTALHTFEPPQARGLIKIASDAGGVYTGAGDGSVWWTAWDGRRRRQVLQHASGVSELRLCTVGDAQVLVSAGLHGDIRLSPLTGSGSPRQFDIGLDVHAVDVHRNGEVVVGTAEGLVRIAP
ncbi:caspase family protein [Streptomyces sp. NPDC058731]|uniref:caspase family protein n=1 Tax=Streptomyces sp. NPDC058731 TaxID=3346613 RepID=UPI0036C90109